MPVPLVLHGSSGVPDAGLAAAVAAGMTKINVATQLNKVFTAAAAGMPGRRPGDGRSAAVHRGRAGRGGRRGDPPARRAGRGLLIGTARYRAGMRQTKDGKIVRDDPGAGQMSRYRRWNELLELLAADGQLQVERAAAGARRVRGHHPA